MHDGGLRRMTDSEQTCLDDERFVNTKIDVGLIEAGAVWRNFRKARFGFKFRKQTVQNRITSV